jgi:CubicO group peptidase (beta-lactamase class C family)
MNTARRALPAMLAALALLVLGGSAAAAPGPPQVGDVGRVLAAQLDASGVPGGAAVVVTADVLPRAEAASVTADRIEALGVGRAGGTRAVTTDTPFVIGSATKSFTALAIMRLADDGRVDLDAPVRDYVPAFELAGGQPVDRITVRHVLQQTSGLDDLAGGPLLASAADGTPRRRSRSSGTPSSRQHPERRSVTPTPTTSWPAWSSRTRRG